MQELQYHYEITLEGARRKQVAWADLTKVLYKNETTVTFEKYVTKLKRVFNVLDKYGVLIYEDQMVEHLI